ncbi:MAG: HflC protein [Candidatus Carbobacillus altaicus]|uniref:Protein HflC n=1 Tax=Candidatus Carbonibacillus altaicus TaxID=2163959 RepID=A0A2R6Y4D2_9BACL|nr:MAG: HflC protein [Candidatus Carbobacillus altaicus]
MKGRQVTWASLVIMLALIILVLSSLFIVREGEYKVVLKFGQAVRIVSEPGIQWKVPFVESIVTLPKRQLVYESPPTPILTRDKKPILVDNYTIWRITDPTIFLRTAQQVISGEQLIENAVYNTVRRKLSEVDYSEIISEQTVRGNLSEEITREVYNLLYETYGISVTDVRIKRTDLPEENKESVFNRMISDRQSMATKYLSEGDEAYKKITAQADRTVRETLAAAEAEAKKIIAEGEQEAARIYNDAYSADPEFYTLYRTLESYRTTLNGQPVIVMPIDSPYTRLLLGK